MDRQFWEQHGISRILTVGETPEDMESARALMGDAGLQLDAASDAGEALEQIRGGNCQLVLRCPPPQESASPSDRRHPPPARAARPTAPSPSPGTDHQSVQPHGKDRPQRGERGAHRLGSDGGHGGGGPGRHRGIQDVHRGELSGRSRPHCRNRSTLTNRP